MLSLSSSTCTAAGAGTLQQRSLGSSTKGISLPLNQRQRPPYQLLRTSRLFFQPDRPTSVHRPLQTVALRTATTALHAWLPTTEHQWQWRDYQVDNTQSDTDVFVKVMALSGPRPRNRDTSSFQVDIVYCQRSAARSVRCSIPKPLVRCTP